MDEELVKVMGKFSLVDKEKERVEIGEMELKKGAEDCKWSVVGKIICAKVVNYNGIKSFAAQKWGYSKKFKIVELGPNFFHLFPSTREEMNRILGGRLWLFDNQMFILKQWKEGIEDDKAAVQFASIWVQVWNLPIHWFSKEVGRKIGQVFHNVIDVKIPETGSKEGRHIKLLVEMDVNQPIVRGTTIKWNGKAKWLLLKYEKCLDFCYNCGLIGHVERNCYRQMNSSQENKELQYGGWLKAAAMSSPRKIWKGDSIRKAEVVHNSQELISTTPEEREQMTDKV
ncbi:hypothetical protein ACH5RR_023722 [Cinchona calisaya]|uniref:CCHC-type domain-containing protein n=1 Tax=Cinchona calisaya TaxID=153742 RepID=A0ABD2ZET7_9GENT